MGLVPLMGFTLQSVSPRWSRTPFGAVALLPFPASRAPALRTKSSRCPAAPGLCSPQRSVLASGRGPHKPMLSWDFCASPERSPHDEDPASRVRPSCASPVRPRGGRTIGAPGISRTHGQASPSRDPPTLLRFSTRTCPRFLPDDSGVLSE
jgi:hypothetical protein